MSETQVSKKKKIIQIVWNAISAIVGLILGTSL